jgi:DNA-binding transcriptional regulator YdaS (Cro superfamily)
MVKVLPDPIARAVVRAGGIGRLAKLLGITPAAIWQWSRVPAERVLEIERHTGVSRHDIRPDLYPIEDTAA